MILHTDTITVDIDKITAMIKVPTEDGDEALGLLVSGQWLTLYDKESAELVERAYIWKHKSYMYDDKLKKIRWIRGEN